ncbi:unnamed protein product [Gongylonema pulchrum]|uniref:DNA mismatch repair protein S5 domain-containing protein n=1 Tax=Gongylonema pulchrum TaxID=637853 RepID=A0A3P7M4A7_9BILA|nr:unnamed protein product [Gongylonema pulchrum]
MNFFEFSEIRTRKMGFEALETVDDGSGIHSDDFDALCKSHATSKLSNFSDFNHLTTFGFRGEALNSLCAVSSLSIITRHADEPLATKLHFDHSGSIRSREKCARTVGTTVTIENLFETLPVRRKEFERTVKKAFAKLLTVVQSFALSRTDVRFVVNSLIPGKQHQALVTPGGNATIKDVIVSLFGARFEKGTILDIVEQHPDETNVLVIYRISGYVSSCVHGQGRSSADRQFVYFNKRPIDYIKLCRIANEVYQQYNRGQYCMLILFVDVPPESIDVNISPDKRSVFFEREKELFALLRASLLATFAPHLGHAGSLNTPISNDLPLSGSADDSFIRLTQINETEDDDDSFDVSAQSFRPSLEPKSNLGPPADITVATDNSRGPRLGMLSYKNEKFVLFSVRLW